MSAPLTLTEIRMMAKRTRSTIVALVILANDCVVTVKAGPRGGWSVVA